MSDEADSTVPEILGELSERGEFEIDPSGDDATVTSDRLDVDTPAGRLTFEALPPEDFGAEHERHDPYDDVYVDVWFVEGYTVVHTRTGPADDASHTLEVHEQRPSERAMELEAHGIPERRAEIAALREQGLTYSEIVDATGSRGPNHRGDVSTHLQKYNEQIHRARWLAENASPVRLGRTTDESADDESTDDRSTDDRSTHDGSTDDKPADDESTDEA